jgi:transcriptional regulator with XRE-family HTH domain
MDTPRTPQQAREALGLTIEQMAKKVRYQPRSLRRLELHGVNSYCVAEYLSLFYQCRVDLWLCGAKGLSTGPDINRVAACGNGRRPPTPENA